MNRSVAGKNVNNYIKLICALAIIVMLAISILVYKAPTGQMITLLLFIVFYVQIPGIAIVESLDTKFYHTSTKLALGMLFGWSLCLAEYFITDFINTNILLYIIGPAVSLAFFISRFREKDGINAHFIKYKNISTAFCVFVVIALLYCLISTQYKYLSPEIAQSTYINPDKAYHMGYINSLSHDYPLQSPWVHGDFVKYHFFTEILWSIPVRLFNVSSDVIVNSFAPLLTTYVVCMSFYSMFREMSSKPERAGAYCLIFILSNMYITRRWDSSIGLKFILENDNSTGYGIAVALMFVVMCH